MTGPKTPQQNRFYSDKKEPFTLSKLGSEVKRRESDIDMQDFIGSEFTEMVKLNHINSNLCVSGMIHIMPKSNFQGRKITASTQAKSRVDSYPEEWEQDVFNNDQMKNAQ